MIGESLVANKNGGMAAISRLHSPLWLGAWEAEAVRQGWD